MKLPGRGRGRSGSSSAMGISPQQFQQLQQRLARPKRAATPVLESVVSKKSNAGRLILGVDPSLRGTGYGIIGGRTPHPRVIAQGTIRCPVAWERTRCLRHIADTLRELLRQHPVDVCVVEALFYAQNLQTALLMGEARGAALVAIAEANRPVFEIAPRKVKQAMVGYGAAQKTAVARMVQRLLNLPALPEPDAADALALALTFAQETNRYALTLPKRI